MREIILIPGLDDAVKSNSFSRRMMAKNVGVTTHVFGWQKANASLSVLQQSLLETVDNAEDRILIIGVSAGGIAAAWALQQRPDKIETAVNVCGALSLPRESHLNRFFSHRYTEHFDEMLSAVQPNSVTDERLLSVRPIYDGIVRRSAVDFGKSRIIDTPSLIHPLAIAYAFKKIIPDIVRAG